MPRRALRCVVDLSLHAVGDPCPLFYCHFLFVFSCDQMFFSRRRTDCCGTGWTVRCASPVMSNLRPLMKFKCLYVFSPIKQLISLLGYLNDTEMDPRVRMLIHKLRIMHLSFENYDRKKVCTSSRQVCHCHDLTSTTAHSPIQTTR